MTYIQNIRLTCVANFILIHTAALIGLLNLSSGVKLGVLLLVWIYYLDYINLIDSRFASNYVNGLNGFKEVKFLVGANCNEE